MRTAIAWMARNSVAANLLMVMILLAGAMGLTRVKQEVFPEFDLDLVTVGVVYPGASPEEVEQGIVLAIEEAVRTIDGVKRVTSTAAEGAAGVSVELQLGVDGDKVLTDVKTAVDRIQTFPEDAERPTVELAARRSTVVSIILSGDQPLSTLEALGERVREELLASDDISQVEVNGVPPLEVAIEVSREKLEGLGLTLGDVANRIGAASLELPGGGLDTESGEILVRVADRRLDGSAFEELVIATAPDGGKVLLGDVATVDDGYEDNDQAHFYQGQRAVRVVAYRTGDEAATTVSDAVHATLERIRPDLPSTVHVAIWDDDSEMLRARIDLLVRNARLGLVLVVLILAVFLAPRLAFWVALGIPISFLGAFLLMPTMDLSINMITLFALIITLGMVVDDAIVVGENAYEKTQTGMDQTKAAIEGAQEMAVPVTFAILTTIAAFAPMFFVPGVMGKIFRLFPGMVIAVLVFSLLESFFILPAHLAHMKDKPASGIFAPLERVREKVAGQLKRFIHGPYQAALEHLLTWRYATLAGALALFLLAVGVVRGGVVPFNFFPKLEGDVVTVSARLPYGSAPERTMETREVLEASLQAAIDHFGDDYVTGVYTRVGESGGGGFGNPQQVGANLLTVEVELVPSGEREFSSQDFRGIWSNATPQLVGVDSVSFNSSAGPGAGAAVAVRLSHSDTEVLAAASEALAAEMRGYADLSDIENSWAAGKPQLDFSLRPEAQALGLTSFDVARQLRNAFYGAEAVREQRGRRELRVMVRLPEEQRRSEHDLDQLRIRTPSGGWVPLSYVADVERGRSPTAIKRQEGRRTVDVSGELAPGVVSSAPVVASVTEDLLPELLATYPGLGAELVGAEEERRESFAALGRNYILAMLAVFTLLAIPFRSYVQPLVVMSAIPFGFVGAVGGHLLMGYELSLISMFGIIALSGVVVNDSLVLIDSANRFRAQGLGPHDAIISAGKRRFRPILLTSLTTFFGLVPMIFETSVQARFLVPMAISLGFGVLFATFVVLLVVPVLYLAVEDVTTVRERVMTKVGSLLPA